MDGEFEKVKELLPTIICNIVAAKEHVAESERNIMVVKERNRGVVNNLPFTYIPRRMKIEFIYFDTLWLNAFLVKSGVSETFSPREILLRWRMDTKKDCIVLPGSYCEVHDEPNPYNTTVSCTHEGIALGPTGDLQGSVKFYCLNTGRVLKRRAFNEIPMPTAVIAKLNKIGKKDNQGKQCRFLNWNKEPFECTDEVPDVYGEFQDLLKEEAPFPDISSELPGVILEDKFVDPTTALKEESEPAFEAKSAAA